MEEMATIEAGDFQFQRAGSTELAQPGGRLLLVAGVDPGHEVL